MTCEPRTTRVMILALSYTRTNRPSLIVRFDEENCLDLWATQLLAEGTPAQAAARCVLENLWDHSEFTLDDGDYILLGEATINNERILLYRPHANFPQELLLTEGVEFIPLDEFESSPILLSDISYTMLLALPEHVRKSMVPPALLADERLHA